MEEFGQPQLLDADTVARARSDVACVELDGEIVLYDDGSRRFHRLSPTAATFWRCLDGSASLRDIAQDLADAYQVEVATVLPQIISLTRSFADEGLLEDPQGPVATVGRLE